MGKDWYLNAHNKANELDPRINYPLQIDNNILPKTSDGILRIERTVYKNVNGVKVTQPLKTIEIKR